jgi:predicted RNA binding protein YcfA (HicA-like mRNA interferase family)
MAISRGYATTVAAVPKTVRQIEKILRAHGWTCERTVGSHRQWTHPDNPYVVTVPGPPGTEVSVGTLSSIRRTTGISELR